MPDAERPALSRKWHRADNLYLQPRRLWWAAAFLVAAVAAGIWIAHQVPAPKAPAPGVSRAALPLRQPALPAVAPVELLTIDPGAARAANAAIPFSAERIVPARKFAFAGAIEDRNRARDCLAAAVWYEAGDDVTGQMSVAQVVLNRARHPAFPHTICGVVFQGSERTTGCQFSFTCDGAMHRRQPSTAAWIRAQTTADMALSGQVLGVVGQATHYHTDWVLPRWSGELDKVARVGTHLFYRWQGYWGSPGVFRQRTDAAEPRVAALATLSPVHGGTDAQTALLGDTSLLAKPEGRATNYPAEAAAGIRDLKGHHVALADWSQTVFALELNANAAPGSYALAALALCRGKAECTVMGWRDGAAMPAKLSDVEARRGAMSFVYQRSANQPEKILWNCGQIKRDQPGQCLTGQEKLTR
ncbi:hypothetical protein BH09PSE3_BH09PSE3_04200 [soil metagenome]